MSSYYPQAGQLELDFEKNLSPAYAIGYDTGLCWDANWMPGGPDVYVPRSRFVSGYIEPEKILKAQQSQFEKNQWHAGFKDGLAQRLADNPNFAEWWDANKESLIGEYARYHAPDHVDN